MKKKIIGYIPTIEGAPARWSDGQLCFCDDNTWLDESFNAILYSKRQVKKMIDKSIKFRRKHNWVLFDDYAYIAVEEK